MSITEGDVYTVRVGANTYKATLKSYIDPNNPDNKIWLAIIHTVNNIVDDNWEKVNDHYEQYLRSHGNNLKKLEGLLHKRGFMKGVKRTRSPTRFRNRSGSGNRSSGGSRTATRRR